MIRKTKVNFKINVLQTGQQTIQRTSSHTFQEVKAIRQ